MLYVNYTAIKLGRGEEISVLGSADLKMEEPAMKSSVPGFLTHVIHEGELFFLLTVEGQGGWLASAQAWSGISWDLNFPSTESGSRSRCSGDRS